MDLKNYIREIPNFPIEGVLYRDITPLLSAPEAFTYAVHEFSKLCKASRIEAIVGVESRGFIFGAPVAAELKLPFVPLRKPGKLPAARMSIEYSLEYGTSQLDIHQDALKKGQRVAVVDDLLATGGTARAGVKLCELVGGKVELVLFAIELKSLGGRAKLGDYRVESLLVYE